MFFNLKKFAAIFCYKIVSCVLGKQLHSKFYCLTDETWYSWLQFVILKKTSLCFEVGKL